VNQLEQKLEGLGLNRREAKVYLSALSLGSFSVTEVAKVAGIKRPTCYLVLEELSRRGLVSFSPRGKKVNYVAEPPEVIATKAEQSSALAKQILPELNSLFKKSEAQPTIKFYLGQKGIQTIYKELLETGVSEACYVGSAQDSLQVAGSDFMKKWVKRRIALGIKAKSIRMRKTEIREKIFASGAEQLREIRYTPNDIFIPQSFMVYGTKVAVISTEKDSFGLVINNKDFAISMKGFFSALWKISKKSG
jgi:sugar-specific transcriptional regulator TrmB